MKILGAFIVLLTSLTAVSVYPPIVSFSSGDFEEEISRPAFLFNPEMSKGGDLQPLYFTWNQFYNNSWYDNMDGKNDNVQEWKNYFKNGLSGNEISTLIYQVDKGYVQQLQRYIGNQKEKVSDSIRSNVFFNFFGKNSYPDFLPYLFFAKECEPYVTESFEWLDEEQWQNNKDSMSVLLEKGKIFYERCRSDFIKTRYGFQIMRLAHYTGRYQECIDFYDKQLTSLKTKSIISYWALEHKAGALRKLGKEAESSYLFSFIFDQCASRRFISYQSFKITSDSSWQTALNLCKTPHEKATLYFLRSITPYAYTLEEMKSIYQIDPSSAHLNILLTRDINKFEERFINSRYPGESYSYYATHFDSNDVSYLKSLQEFIGLCVKEQAVNNPDLWALANGYIEFLLGNFNKAKSVYATLRATKDTLIKKQLPLFETALSVAAIEKLNKSHEDILFAQVLLSEHDELLQYTINTFEQLSKQNGDTVKTFLCNNSLETMREDFNLAFVNKTIAWADNPHKTMFEKYLTGQKLRTWNASSEPKENLLELKGTILLSQDKIQDAVAAFKKTSEFNIWNSGGDPFSSHLKDSEDRDSEEWSMPSYNKLSLTEKILEYQKKIKSDPSNTAHYYFLLGNVFFNITYFGNSAEAILYNRERDLSYALWNTAYERTGIIPIQFDCRLAQSYFQKGMESANKSGDYELAAKCCFMAAKCEQNLYYVLRHNERIYKTIKKENFRTYFKILKENYNSTKYYLKAIEECKYFHNFVNK